MLPFQTVSRQDDRIVIVGIGGAGANVLQCFGGSSAENVRLCTMSLDERLGKGSGNVEFLQLGAGLNHGLGSGGDPEVGHQAAQESEGEIMRLLDGAKLLVMVAGLGGGTGSGAAPVVARMAKDAGLFLVTVAVMPFAFEGRRRREQAETALDAVSSLSDIVYCFENDYMEELFRSRTGARAVFEEVNRLLAKATASVPMLASSPGLINLGIDELATALENSDSRCIFGSGSGYGAHRAEAAAQAALQSPLMAFHHAVKHTKCVIAHVAGGDSMSLSEVRIAMETVRAALADEEVTLYFGTSVKPHLGDEMRVTLIGSIDGQEFNQTVQAARQAAAAVQQQEQSEELEASAEADEEPLDPQEVEPYAEEEEEEPEAVESTHRYPGSAVPGVQKQSLTDAPVAALVREESATLLEPEEPEYTEPAMPSAWDVAATSLAAPLRGSAHRVAPLHDELAGDITPAGEDEKLFDVAPEAPRYSREAAQQTADEQSLGRSAPAPVAPPQQTTLDLGLGAGADYLGDDLPPTRARDFFAHGDQASNSQSFETARKPRGGESDDLDTPPSLRFNDLRDMFPDN